MRVLLAFCFLATSIANDSSLEVPDVLFHSDNEACEGGVAAWCDSARFPVHCAILRDFNEYGCSCLGNAAHCPSECLNGSEQVSRTKYGIRCSKIPEPGEPNYVLKESHPIHRCENNAAVASWCDDFVNKHLTCGLYPDDDQYLCKCSGRLANCPDECIGGSEPLIKTSHSVLCAGIPDDSPNFILKEKKAKNA